MEAKKKMGRPPIENPEFKRDKYVCTPMTKEEKDILVKHAKSYNTSISTLIRTLVFQSLENLK